MNATMGKHLWKSLFVFLSSLAISLLVAPLRGGGITILGLSGLPLSLLAGSVLFFAMTLFFLKRYSSIIPPWAIVLVALFGACIIEIPVRVLYFQSTLVSLPDIVLKLISIMIGYVFFKIRSTTGKIVLSVFAVLLYLWSAYVGYDLWVNKLNYGTFTGRTNSAVEGSVIFQNEHDENVSLKDFEGKYLILDFWSSSCGVCYKKFPEVQKVYDTYKATPEIEVYAVFCRTNKKGETAQTGQQILEERGYTFPSLSMDMDDPILKEIRVSGFPTVIIFNPKGELIFRGRIEGAQKYIDTLKSRR